MSEAAATQRVHPSPDTLDYWADHLLPDLDAWYWDDGEPAVDLTGCVVMPRADYLQHPTFRAIPYVNAYLHWQMPREVTHVVVSGPAWISSLTAERRRHVLGKQVKLHRGLVFPRSHFDELPDALHAYAFSDHVVLSHAAWEVVPNRIRQLALLKEQARWDDTQCFEIPDNTPAHIRAIANTFGTREGANCLATTAYCVTGEPWVRDLWMFQPAFRDLIARHGYRPVPDVSPVTKDVVTFEVDGEIVHAAWCVGQDRFLSKNGQSRFNPIRIIDWARLEADWHNATLVIFRRQPALHGGRR
jgi:hypothetical protein